MSEQVAERLNGPCSVDVRTDWMAERRAEDNGNTWQYVNSGGSRETLERWLPLAHRADPLAEFRIVSRTVMTVMTDWRPVTEATS